MSLSLLKYGAAVLAVASGVAAQAATYELTENFTPTNFFDSDKFGFFVSKFDGTPEQIDPTHGFVDYQTKANAESLKLIEKKSDHVYIGVEKTNTLLANSKGRKSVRIESKSTYDSGLFIAQFKKFPKPACGAWPAFWMTGPDWPLDGEVDLYESWNLPSKNSVTGHSQTAPGRGDCKISQNDFAGTATTTNCNVTAPNQWFNQGCSADETSGLLGRAQGGVYAMEWTDDAIKVWSWKNAPANVLSTNPTPGAASWGAPQFQIKKDLCDIEKNFNKMRIIFDITFCGDAAGNQEVWNGSGCKSTNYPTCVDHVKKNGNAYADTNWEIKGIKVFQKKAATTTTSSTTSSTTSTTSATTTSTTSATTTSTTSATTTSTTSATTTSTTSDTTTSTTSATTTSTTSGTTSTTSGTTSTTSGTTTSTTSGTTTSTTSGTTSTTSGTTSTTSGTTTSTGTNTAGPTGGPHDGPHDGDDDDDDDFCDDDDDEDWPTGKPTRTATRTGTRGPTGTGKPPGGHHGDLTTSTVYATQTFTVSSCAPTVTNCPYGHVTTKVVAVSTTVCPVDEADETPKGGSWPRPTGGAPDWDVPSGGAPPHGGPPAPTGGAVAPSPPTGGAPPAGGAPHGGAPGAPDGAPHGAPPAGGASPAGGAAPHGGAPPAGGASPAGGAAPHGGAPAAPGGAAPTWVSVQPAAPQGTGSGVKPVVTGKPVVIVNGGVKAGVSVVAVMGGALMAMLL